MPNTNFITISQKIKNEKRKENLIKLIKQCLPEGYGAIVRTSAEKIDEEKIKQDIENLLEKWKEINTKFINFYNNKMYEI